jgi:hypothetical protein
MSCEHSEAVHFGHVTERVHLEQLFDEYYLRVSDLQNESDSYRDTYSYREAYDDSLYNMECISNRLDELDAVE